MDFSVYIGSAITITKTPLREVKTIKKVCSSVTKHKLSNGDFCPICGSPKIDKEYISEAPINLGEIWEEYNDSFYWNDDVFMENGRNFCYNICDSDIIENSLNLSKFNLDKFKEFSKDFLKVLDENKIEYKISNIIKTMWT